MHLKRSLPMLWQRVCRASSRALLLAMPAAVLALAGCGGSNRTSGSSGGASEATAPGPAFLDDPQHCAELLERAIGMAEPDQLGLRTDRKAIAGGLNDWTAQCTQTGDEQSLPIDERYAALLGEETAARLAAAFFTAGDADHLRAALLLRTVAHKVVQGHAADVDRSVALFDWVVRNVALEDRPLDAAPVTPFDIVVLGRGTPNDRAWVFAELLRQLALDAMRVRPGGPNADDQNAGAAFLVGVPIEGETFLFDVRLGTPVPSGDATADEPLVLMPATLDAAARDPQVLKRLATGESGPAPFASQDLATVRIDVITSSLFSAPRMERLKPSLSGRLAAEVFVPLFPSGDDAGEMDRLAQAGGQRWAAEDVSVWPYPDAQLRQFAALDQPNIHEQHRWLQAPFPIESLDEFDRPQFGRGRNELLTARLEHLLEPPQTVIPMYVRLRGAERTLVPGIDPETRKPFRIPEEKRDRILAAMAEATVHRDLLRQAAQHAFFWTALAQFEQGEFESAGATLKSYVAEFPGGERSVAARQLLARALVERQQFAEAAQVLRDLLAAHPRHAGRASTEWFLDRWQGLTDRPKDDAGGTP